MTRTVEVADPSTHFTGDSRPVTTSDRHGGDLTAVVGQRIPTADGKGQLVFFWHGTTFIGWDAVTETDSIRRITAGPGYFTVTYTHYAAKDPMCCASLPPVTITYAWQDSGRFVPSGEIPHHGDPIRVKLLS
ncbi:LppP/LprE family lipoprotein [Actinoallomurus purpureus]|uniref:LppP/LprE family lipoprotein n=1 Tax=Actinoallomurus purpureus TaxID=478114 RepID=UPI0020923EA9|nr:LppP/LprE family lipoprotein [Actinoallomurus purpureus]MCO6009233.1 LppP/LprE family lipoprotein [Actinoallomurus purpureus]